MLRLEEMFKEIDKIQDEFNKKNFRCIWETKRI